MTNEQVTYSSMAQCAGTQGIPKTLLEAAKANGCPGFRDGGRVDWALVKPWLDINLEEIAGQAKDSKELKDFKLLYDGLLSKLEYEHEQGLYLKKSDVVEQVTRLATATANLLRTRLEDELPARIQGLDAVAIKEVLSKTVDEICNALQSTNWGDNA